MSLAFLNQKGFHPANKMNQKRLFEAEERVREEERRTKEFLAEQKAQEVSKTSLSGGRAESTTGGAADT